MAASRRPASATARSSSKSHLVASGKPFTVRVTSSCGPPSPDTTAFCLLRRSFNLSPGRYPTPERWIRAKNYGTTSAHQFQRDLLEHRSRLPSSRRSASASGSRARVPSSASRRRPSSGRPAPPPMVGLLGNLRCRRDVGDLDPLALHPVRLEQLSNDPLRSCRRRFNWVLPRPIQQGLRDARAHRTEFGISGQWR